MTDHVSEQIWPPVSRTIDNTGYDRGSYAHKGEVPKGLNLQFKGQGPGSKDQGSKTRSRIIDQD